MFASYVCYTSLAALPVLPNHSSTTNKTYASHRLAPRLLLIQTNKACMFNVTASGLAFYLYNELATMTVKAVGPVGSSVANTAKRVIVMLYMAAVTGKALTEEQQIGAAVAIGGVMLYSVIDNIFASKPKKN